MSILSVDFGSVHTRAVLFDRVEGRYQLVAAATTRTTTDFPVSDIAVGLDRVLRELTETTGRSFTGPDGRIATPENADRIGVDVFAATASAGRPLRAVVLGLYPDLSLASALRAASGTYVDIAATLHLDDGQDEDGRLNTILLNTPDVIVIAGGIEGGARASVLEMVAVTRLAVALIDPSRRPTVIYAGNSALAEMVTRAFEGLANVLIARNVRPTVASENIDSAQLQLARAFDLYKEERSQDFAPIATASAVGLLPTAQGYRVAAGYYSRTQGGRVALIDLGGATGVLAAGGGGAVATVIRGDLGLGQNALALLNGVGTEAVRAWLPFYASETEIYNYAANKTLRPAGVAAAVRDLYLEHALLRAGLTALVAMADLDTGNINARPLSMIVGGGAGLTGVGHPGLTALLLLDALQPTGVSALYADPAGVLPAMGAVANVNPEAAVQILDGANLERLGTAISLNGIPALDKNAVRVRITDAGGQVTQQIVKGGHLWVYPLGIGQTATVRLRAIGRGLSINGRRRWRIKVEGGSAGIVIDARGRAATLTHPAARLSVAERAAQMPLWAHEVTGDPLVEIDPAWLQAPVAEPTVEAPARGRRRGERPERRRGLFGRRRGGAQAASDDALGDLLADDLSDDAPTEGDTLKELRDASLS
jgi:hypothetical protein